MKAIILCGGRGTRLGKLTEDKQKCALEVGGQPFILYVLEEVQKHLCKEVVLAIGWRWEDIFEIMPWSASISYSYCEKGTGFAVRQVLAELGTEDFYIVNGDTYMDLSSMDEAEYEPNMSSKGLYVLPAGLELMKRETLDDSWKYRRTLQFNPSFRHHIGTPEGLKRARRELC